MTRHMVLLSVAFAAALAVPVSASVLRAKTPHKTQISWTVAQSPTLQSAQVHALVGASFHGLSAGY